MRYNGKAGLYAETGQGVLIDNCIIESNRKYGVYLKVPISNNYPPNNWTFNSNWFENNGADGENSFQIHIKTEVHNQDGEPAHNIIFDRCELSTGWYGKLINMDDAKDIAQEVFINVFKSIDKFKGKSTLSTWIYRMAVNKSLNFLRDSKKRKFYFNLDSINKLGRNNPRELSDDSSFSYLEKNEAEYKKKIIFKAIDRLPEKQRIAFLLSKYEEKSYKEIAEIMNTSFSAVESLIFRAKQKLKNELVFLYKNKI